MIKLSQKNLQHEQNTHKTTKIIKISQKPSKCEKNTKPLKSSQYATKLGIHPINLKGCKKVTS